MVENQIISGPYRHLGLIGAGAWGTALAVVAAGAGQRVTVWGQTGELVEAINRRHESVRFLPGIRLSRSIVATAQAHEAIQADAILIAVPAQRLRTTLAAVARDWHPPAPLVICAKGIERSTGRLVNEVAGEIIPEAEYAVLSGPSFASDVARGLPTAVTIAASPDIAARLQATLGTSTFRPYASRDIVGVALGGAAKNVYAIACGIVAGLGLGESARAALLARGFAELVRLGEAIGAKRETLMGLSGLGDLVLTATSAASRNYAFGFALAGSGRALTELCAPDQPLAEGVETAPALVARARQVSIELPVAEATAAIVAGLLEPAGALVRLMTRPLTSE